MRIRPPAVSGMFYPKNPTVLRGMIQKYLQEAVIEENPLFPKAIIAPHAGYVYSGPIAATVYQRVAAFRDCIRRVLLLGPSHRVAFRGVAAPTVDFFETPLGRIPVDQHTIAQVRHPLFGYLDQAHAQEHSLEVHLPFLQEILNDFQLIPLVVGDADADVVAAVLEAFWGGAETLVVISSDLSHFEDYPTAMSKDKATSDAIVRLDGQNLDGHQACGCRPIRGLLKMAKKMNMTAQLLDLRNSGDTAGTKDRVVGYGAYCFTEKPS